MSRDCFHPSEQFETLLVATFKFREMESQFCVLDLFLKLLVQGSFEMRCDPRKDNGNIRYFAGIATCPAKAIVGEFGFARYDSSDFPFSFGREGRKRIQSTIGNSEDLSDPFLRPH
jgi:hypothetical protein